MKRILILSSDSHFLYNTRIELIERLIEQKYDVYFVAPESINDERVKLIQGIGASYRRVFINRRGMNVIEDFKLINDFKRVIEDVKPDIILTFTIKPNIYGSYVGKKNNVPVIMNITGLGTSLITGKYKKMIKLMYKYACTKATKVFFQNDSNRDFFLSNNLIKEEKIEMIPGSGVNTKKFRPLSKTKKDDMIKFLFIGRLMKDKGIEEYLDVADRVTQKYDNTEFQILGDFEEDKYKDIIKNNKNKQIKYLGVSKDVRNEIREVDAIVNPSYHEGMSNVLLEGGAMGKFLIASNIPGCKEIIDDNINGFLFEPKSNLDLEKVIIKFIKLKEIDECLVKEDSIKKIKEKFDRDIVTNKYLKSINEIFT